MTISNIQIKVESLSKGPRGQIYGDIWIEVNGLPFPGENWSDFAVIILGWWLEYARLLHLKQENSCIFSFMDGPYEFEIELSDNENWLVTLVERNFRSSKFCFPARLFIQTLLDKGNEVLRECERHGWSSSDVDTLAKHYISLSPFLVSRSEQFPLVRQERAN